MAYDKSRKTTDNGTSIKPVVDTSNIFSTTRFKNIFSKDTIDIKNKNIITLRGTTIEGMPKQFKPFSNMPTITKQVGDKEIKTSVNMEMVNILKNIGIYGLHENTPLAHTAMHGFTFNYQQQKEIRTSTVDAAVKAFTKVKQFEKNKVGSLYVFDLETFGGTTDDNRWSPAGITEFAMQKVNFTTGKRTSTNILMTNDETIADLERYLKKYNELMDKGGIAKVKQHNDVYVFAKRMSLYDPLGGADFELKNGIWQAKKLIATEDEKPGNVDVVTRGVNKFISMNKELKEKGIYLDSTTGLPRDVKALLNASAEMSNSVANKTGVIGGHNILQFDRGVLDKQIRGIYNKQMGIINNSKSTAEQIKQAQAKVDYMHSVFGSKNVGLNFAEGYVLDTFPLMKAARDEGGFLSPNLKLETLGPMYYAKEAAEGVAHLGIHDVEMNLHVILDPSEQLEGKSLVQHVMDKYLYDFNEANKSQPIASNQVFKVTNNIFPTSATGRGYANYIRYHSTGEIYTSGNYKVNKDKIKYDKYAGNIGFEKGGFYSVSGQGYIDLNTLAPEQLKQLQDAYPELNTNTNKVFHMAFESKNVTKYSNPHTVHMFTSTQEEMEAMIGSSMVHVANQTTTGYDVVDKNLSYLVGGAYNKVTGEFEAKDPSNATDIVLTAMRRQEMKTVNERANSAVFTGKQSMKNIYGLLSFDKEARKKELGKGLDLMAENNIPLTTILKSNSGTINNIEYFNDKQLAQLKKIYTNNLGYKGDIDIRTLTKTSAAYERVISQKEYYNKLITATLDNFGKRDFSGYPTAEMNEYFLQLNRQVTSDVLSKAGYSNDKIKRVVNNVSEYSTHEYAYFNNRYEFKIGHKFKRVGRTSDKLDKPFSLLEENGDILTYNVGDNNAASKFINQLYNLRMGSEAKNNLHDKDYIDAHKKQAVFEFFLDLDANGDTKALYKDKNLKKYVKSLTSYYELSGKAPEDFDANEAITRLGKVVEKSKDEDMFNGIINLVGNANATKVDTIISKQLNDVSSETVSDISKNVKRIVKYNDKNRSDEVSKLVDVFGIDSYTFEEAVKDMSPIDRKTKRLIRDLSHEQLSTYFDDILKTTAALGIDVHVDELNKIMILQKGDQVQVLEKMPKIFMGEDKTIRLLSGGSDVNIDLTFDLHNTSKGELGHVTTNIDSRFGRKDYFYDMFKSRMYRNGSIDLSDFDKYVGTNLRESYENTRHSGLKTDLTTANKRIDISPLTTRFIDLFKTEGNLNSLLDDYNFVDKDLPTKMRKNIDLLKVIPGGDMIKPEAYMIMANDISGLSSLIIDPESAHYDEIIDIMKYTGPGLKETAFVKGKLQIGNRPIGTWTNGWDNPSRPPMTGAGNINMLDVNNINKLKNLNVLPGSIIESNDTMDLIYKKDQANRLLSSDFRSRQVYMSAPNIQARMKSQKEIIMNADINNLSITEMTNKKLERLYDKLTETLTSGTYEQARIGDARIFNEVINMPVDVQYLSPNKNIMDTIDEAKDQKQFERLVNLVGRIERNESGELVYNRDRSGTIVKKGEGIVKHLAYGDIEQTFGSKHKLGVLSFSISSNGIELTDKEVTNILRDYDEFFKDLDTEKDQDKMLHKLLGILEKKEMRATYKISNVNEASLLKVQDSGVEKGMTYLPKAKLGELDENIEKYFKVLRGPLSNKSIPTKEAIIALHEDIASDLEITVEELVKQTSDKAGLKFNSMQDLFKSIKIERETPAQLIFGKYGAFNNYSSIANDNIPKHENIGLDVFGKFSEAINKYSQVSGKSYEESAKILTDAMQKDDSLNFIRHTINGSYNNTSGYKLSVNKDGTLLVDEVDGETKLLDEARLANFFKYENDLIKELDANVPEDLKLVHENVYSRDKDGKLVHHPSIIGNFTFRTEYDSQGKEIKVIDGSSSYVNHSIIKDSETISGVSQEYIDARTAINKLSVKDPKMLSTKQRKELKELKELVGAQKDSSKYITADEQMLSLLKADRFTSVLAEDMTNALDTKTGREQFFNRNSAEFLTKKTGGDIKYDKNTDKIIFDGSIKGFGTYDAFVDQIEKWQFYNPAKEAELTDELLKKPEYKHLKDVRDSILKLDGINKVGTESAQNIYDLQGMHSAAMFNNRKTFNEDEFKNMIDTQGFELMHINDYIPAEGSATGGTIESIRDKRIMLDLGEGFTNDKRYIAIPAGGKQIGDNDALTKAQGKLKQLKTQSDILKDLEGGELYNGMTYQQWLSTPEEERKLIKDQSKINDAVIEKVESTYNKMQEIRNDIIEATNAYPQKGGAFTRASKVEIPQASTRSKILSITNTSLTNEALAKMGLSQYKVDPNSEDFMRKAKIMMGDGTEKSLFELGEQGIHYDYERVGIHEFINAGYFDSKGNATPETLKKFGMKDTEELIDYLQTYGDADIAMRFPLIRSDSVYGTRKYLDRQFDFTNAKSVSSPSMLAYNGDSDGDSESSFQAKINDVSFALYEYQRKQAMAELRTEGQEITQDTIKERVISKGIIPEDTYEGFRKFSVGMDIRASLVNPEYANRVESDIIKDITNNVKVGKLDNTIYQFKDAESKTFNNFRIESMHLNPDGQELKANAEGVQAAINYVLQTNPSVYDEGLLKQAQQVASGAKDVSVIVGTQKYKLLDKTMKAIEEDTTISTDTFDAMQRSLVDKARYQQLYEEASSKSTKSVIGPVNKTFSSAKLISNEYFRGEDGKYNDMANILFEAGYQIEQKTVISGKKVAFEVGDVRVKDLEDLLGKAFNGKSGANDKKALADWFDIYMPEDSTNEIWNKLRPSTRSELEKDNGYIQKYIASQLKYNISSYSGIEGEELQNVLTLRAKNRFIAEQIIDAGQIMSGNKVIKSTMRDLKSLGGNMSTASIANRTNIPASFDFMTTRASNLIKQVDYEQGKEVILESGKKKVVDKNIQDAIDYLTNKDTANSALDSLDGMLDITDVTEAFSNTASKNINTETLLKETPKAASRGLGMAALGVAAGLMIAGYAGGGHQRPTKPQDDSQPVEITPMLDDTGGDNGMRQQGYVININADTRKGARHLKRTMKDVARASQANGDISINMNYKTTKGGGYSNKDIENIINNFI
ncbi:MAG: hypothetical protein ACI3T9_02905 [Romboutsia timonensis]